MLTVDYKKGVSAPCKKATLTKMRYRNIEVEGKACRDCGQLRPLEHFHADASGVGGKKAICKFCRYKPRG